MKKGEIGILSAIAVSAIALWIVNDYRMSREEGEERGIPFYSDAPMEVRERGGRLYKELGCRDCHTLWGIRNPMQAVPAPSLDGIGSLKTEQWLYDYLSSEDPQSILPSRLKDEYKMPSYAFLPEEDRRILAAYLASLKVEPWYLDEVKRSEYEKLTGEAYVDEDGNQ